MEEYEGGKQILQYILETWRKIEYLKSLGVDITFKFDANSIANIPNEILKENFQWQNLDKF